MQPIVNCNEAGKIVRNRLLVFILIGATLSLSPAMALGGVATLNGSVIVYQAMDNGNLVPCTITGLVSYSGRGIGEVSLYSNRYGTKPLIILPPNERKQFMAFLKKGLEWINVAIEKQVESNKKIGSIEIKTSESCDVCRDHLRLSLSCKPQRKQFGMFLIVKEWIGTTKIHTNERGFFYLEDHAALNLYEMLDSAAETVEKDRAKQKAQDDLFK